MNKEFCASYYAFSNRHLKIFGQLKFSSCLNFLNERVTISNTFIYLKNVYVLYVVMYFYVIQHT